MNIATIFKLDSSGSPIQVDIENCMDCIHKNIQSDPDPDDWFCDDDMKLLCKINYRIVTRGCRPHQLRKECEVPSWCKFLKKEV